MLDDLTSAYYHRVLMLKDPYETAFREGQRSVIIRIINLIKEDKMSDEQMTTNDNPVQESTWYNCTWIGK